MKNDLPYFSHDNNASQHPKMRALIAEYGFEGYGRFWALNEMIARNAGACIDISRKVYKLNLANELRFDECGLDNFLKFISDPEIDLINIENGLITTDRINELYSKIMGSREAERDRIKEKREQKTEGENVGANNSLVGTESEDLQPNKDTDKIRSDKSKLNKTKLDSSDVANESKRFIKPSVDEVRLYIQEMKYSIDAESFIAFYESKGWKIGKSPMKNWRAACVTWERRNQQVNKPSGAGPPGKLAGKKSLGGLEIL